MKLLKNNIYVRWNNNNKLQGKEEDKDEKYLRKRVHKMKSI